MFIVCFRKKLPQIKSPENIQGNKEQKYLVFTFFKNTVQINLEGINPVKKKVSCIMKKFSESSSP